MTPTHLYRATALAAAALGALAEGCGGDPNRSATMPLPAPAPYELAQTSEESVLQRLRAAEEDGSLTSAAFVAGLPALSEEMSPPFAAATAVELHRAGVFHGSPRLMTAACDLARSVADLEARRASRLDEVVRACELIERPALPSRRDPCARAIADMRKAFAQLAGGQVAEARRDMAEAERRYGQCPGGRRIPRTPLDPKSPGFMVVVFLNALNAPDLAWMAGESVPPTFSQNIQRTYAQGEHP